MVVEGGGMAAGGYVAATIGGEDLMGDLLWRGVVCGCVWRVCEMSRLCWVGLRSG